jgi:hypothetical protein
MATATATAANSTQAPDAKYCRQFFAHHLGASLPKRDQVQLHCPFHDDRSPSLSVNLRTGVWKCQAGCGEGGLIDFEIKRSNCDRETAKLNIARILGVDLFRSNGGPEAVYQYRDAQGAVLFEKLRYPGKKFMQRRQTQGGYTWNLDGVNKPLYHLPEVLTANELFVCEGEKDTDKLTAEISASNLSDVHFAVTCNFGGAGQWDDTYNVYFAGKKVVVLPDNDDSGQRHAERIAAALHPLAAGVKVVKLPGLQEKGDVSDYLHAHSVSDLLGEVARTPLWSPSTAVPIWRSVLKSYDELEKGEFEFLIDKFLPHGITFFAGLPGAGKTWLALSAVKALLTGNNMLHNFRVLHAFPVVYLIPEAGDISFRTRLEAMRLTGFKDRLLCRTMKTGPTLALSSPEIKDAIRALKPVVVLDTAIRFSNAEDENSAAQNRELVNEMFNLLSLGAEAIIAIHHSPKSSANSTDATLENTLRGTGDLGAVADAVYSLRCEDQKNLSILVQCVKPRDFEPPLPFHIQGRPYINDLGDFAVIEPVSEEEKLARALVDNPSASLRELAGMTGISKSNVTAAAARLGWKQVDGLWVQGKTIVQ